MFDFCSAACQDAVSDTFNAVTMARGDHYFRSRAVSEASLSRSENSVLLSGKVQGSVRIPYSVQIKIVPLPSITIETTCNCPILHACKHSYALLRFFESEQQKALSKEVIFPPSLPLAPVLRAPEIKPDKDFEIQPAIRKDVTAWLENFEQSLQNLAQKPPTEELFFVLQGSPRLTVAAFAGPIGKLTAARYTYGTVGSLASSLSIEDRELFAKLNIAKSGYPAATSHALGGLLPVLIQSGRCYWKSHWNPALKSGQDITARLGWKSGKDGSQRTCLEIPEGLIVLEVTPRWYVDPKSNECGLLKFEVPDAAVERWLTAPVIKPDETQLVAERLKTSAPAVPKPVVVEQQYIRDFKPQVMLQLAMEIDKLSWSYREEIPVARLTFNYLGKTFYRSAGANEIRQKNKGAITTILRNHRFEKAQEDELLHAGFFKHGYQRSAPYTMEEEVDWLQFMQKALPLLRQQGWQVEISADFPFNIAAVEEWYGETEERNEWFSVELGVKVDGVKINLLPVLMHQLSIQGEKIFSRESLESMEEAGGMTLRLEDGRMVLFPVDRLRSVMGILLELFNPKSLTKSGKILLSKMRACELEENDLWRWKTPAEIRAFAEMLKARRGTPRTSLPDGFHAELRPYQMEGLNWLQFLREHQFAGILADDMGLGKTVQALAHLLLEKAEGRMDKPSLIVAPTSLLNNWKNEAARFTPELKALVLHGLQRKQWFENLKDYDLVITSYALLPRDEAILQKQEFHCLLLDEAQYIKNSATNAAQVACTLKARHRLCMTGTPIENHLGELWSQFNFLLPGFLGDEVCFRRQFRNPIEKSQNKERREILARRVAPFILRRKKEDVLKELPPKTEIVQTMELDGRQRDLYETIRLAMHEKVRQEVNKKGMNRSHIIILDALLKLRQVCCDPRLVKLAAAKEVKESAKLDWIKNSIPQMIEEGRRILLFSQFTSMLALIEKEMHLKKISYVKLTGETTDRQTPVNSFQNKEVPLFLLSLKAGGTGLNLTAADTVVLYDPWWNPAVENQAMDRAHRIGQEKNVFVYKLMTSGTVEEKILALQKHKRELVQGLLENDPSQNLKLSEADLEDLFAPLT